MMRVLAIDTALDACSVVLADLDRAGAVQTAHVASEAMVRGHAERLFPLLTDAVAASGWALDTVERIVATVGPGTFTGTRVGLAAARSMALALGCPCLGITSLEALEASASRRDGMTASAIDARRDTVYLQLFSAGGVAVTDPEALGTAAAARAIRNAADPKAGLTIVGSAAPLLAPLLSDRAPDSAPMAAPAPESLLGFARDDPQARPPKPLYLRPPDAAPAKPPAWMRLP